MTVYRIEAGRVTPHRSSVLLLSAALGVEPADLTTNGRPAGNGPSAKTPDQDGRHAGG